MINEERVKELYKMAVFDDKNQSIGSATGTFWIGDYIGKELVKSFLYGTVAYAIIVMLWALNDMDQVMDMMNNLAFEGFIMDNVLYYGIFILLYLAATIAVYYIRYRKGRKELDSYLESVKKVNKMYERDEKLKV